LLGQIGLSWRKMTRNNRLAAALLLVTAALTLVLAAAIPELELQPGQKFTVPIEDDPTHFRGRRYDAGEGLLFLMRFLFAAAIVGLPFFLLYSLFTPEGRRRLLALLIILAAVFLIISSRQETEPPPPTPPAELMETLQAEIAERSRLRQEALAVAEEPPDWILYTVITSGALFLTAIVAAAIWYYRKRAIDSELTRLGLDMRQAIETIEAGGDLGSTILTAYRDMGRVVRHTQGIERAASTTPHEFISVLVGKGLPQSAVMDITRLFERVRYGSKLATDSDEACALASLRAIASACEERPRAI
jgi:Na+-transporting methylmalonyl-CoA/oxaloacetate decarboxylase gamma subunit